MMSILIWSALDHITRLACNPVFDISITGYVRLRWDVDVNTCNEN